MTRLRSLHEGTAHTGGVETSLRGCQQMFALADAAGGYPRFAILRGAGAGQIKSSAPVCLQCFQIAGIDLYDARAAFTREPQVFTAPFFRGVSTHGTGCTYSAAIAAGLARGVPLPEAIRSAKAYVTRAIGSICRWGGVDALNHSSLA